MFFKISSKIEATKKVCGAHLVDFWIPVVCSAFLEHQ